MEIHEEGRDGKARELARDVAVKEFLSRYPAASSRRIMGYNVVSVCRAALAVDPEFRWDGLTDAAVSGILGRLQQQGMSPSTINNRLCVIKGIAYRLWVDDRLPEKRWRLIEKIRHVRGSRVGHGRMLSDQEISDLFKACDTHNRFTDVRDAAIFAVMLGGGLRRSEAAGLRISDIMRDEGAVFLRLIGKGNKQRDVYLPRFAIEKLRLWLDLRGDADGPLFTRITGGEKVTLEGFSGKNIWKICRKHAQLAGMEKWTPHDCRRTCASKMIAAGIDLDSVRDFLGHSSVLTTQIYDRRPKSRLRSAAEKIGIGAA